MIEESTIARAQIDPEDFRGTTLAAEPVERPDKPVIAELVEPLALAGEGRKVSIIRVIHTQDEDLIRRGDGYVVNWDVILEGGTDKGLHFPGILEEVSVRYNPRKEISRNLMSANAWMFPG